MRSTTTWIAGAIFLLGAGSAAAQTYQPGGTDQGRPPGGNPTDPNRDQPGTTTPGSPTPGSPTPGTDRTGLNKPLGQGDTQLGQTGSQVDIKAGRLSNVSIKTTDRGRHIIGKRGLVHEDGRLLTPVEDLARTLGGELRQADGGGYLIEVAECNRCPIKVNPDASSGMLGTPGTPGTAGTPGALGGPDAGTRVGGTVPGEGSRPMGTLADESGRAGSAGHMGDPAGVGNRPGQVGGSTIAQRPLGMSGSVLRIGTHEISRDVLMVDGKAYVPVEDVMSATVAGASFQLGQPGFTPGDCPQCLIQPAQRNRRPRGDMGAMLQQ